MSSASGAVRFPDGTVKFTVYHGTSDVMFATLYDTLAEAWDSKSDRFAEPNGPLEDVEIYSDYGYGFWWHGQAARNAIDPRFLSWWSDDGKNDLDRFDGTPDWFSETSDE